MYKNTCCSKVTSKAQRQEGTTEKKGEHSFMKMKLYTFYLQNFLCKNKLWHRSMAGVAWAKGNWWNQANQQQDGECKELCN